MGCFKDLRDAVDSTDWNDWVLGLTFFFRNMKSEVSSSLSFSVIAVSESVASVAPVVSGASVASEGASEGSCSEGSCSLGSDGGGFWVDVGGDLLGPLASVVEPGCSGVAPDGSSVVVSDVISGLVSEKFRSVAMILVRIGWWAVVISVTSQRRVGGIDRARMELEWN